MARIYRPRAPRRNRFRIYTIVSLVIIVAIIAYIYIPGGEQSEPNNTGLITNSSDTTVQPGSEESSRGQENPNTSDVSLQGTLPDWTTSTNGDTATSTPERPEAGHPERINENDNPPITAPPAGIGEITTSVQQPVQQGNSEADKLIAQANALLKQGVSQYIPARDKFNEALRSRTISARQAQFVKKQLSDLADDWLFNRGILQGDSLCGQYKVQSGDRLEKIGERNKVPYDILMTINNISDPRKLRAGQNLKIVKGPFNVKVYRSSFTMDVYLQNTYVRTFKVGLGLPGSETPTGMWKVKVGGKLIEPIWTDKSSGKTYYPSDPEYPLGSRWIALEGVSGEAVGRQGFAIHGTHKPEQLGTQGSQGCIRMDNGAAIMVYNMLIPGYSTVEVLD